MRDERFDEHDRLSLSNEGRGGSDDGLSTGNAHGPEENDGELCDEVLEPSVVVEELDEGDEEDDRRENTEHPPLEFESLLAHQESCPNGSEAEKRGGEEGDEVEDIILFRVSVCPV